MPSTSSALLGQLGVSRRRSHRKGFGPQPQHRHGPIEHPSGDHRPEGDHVLGLAEHEGRRRDCRSAPGRASPRCRCTIPAWSASPAPGRSANCPRSGWCASITTPVSGSTPPQKAQALVAGQNLALRPSGNDALAGHLTTNPWAKGSRSSMKMVLMPVTRAHPEIEGMMAGLPATRRRRLHPALEERPDDAFVNVVVAHGQFALGRQAAPCAMRCPCRRGIGQSPCRHRAPHCDHAPPDRAARLSTGYAKAPISRHVRGG